MDKDSIGQKTLKARKAKGLTQAELSEISSISIRTIQRLESGYVIPRAYTLKTISKYLDVDLLTELDHLKKTDNKELVHDLMIKWKTEIRNLFNLKTYTMKKIIILSAFFATLTIGLFAITNDSKKQENSLSETPNSAQGNTSTDNKDLPCGFYAQVINGDTTFYGLITENYVALKEIAPTPNYTSDFGYNFSLLEFSAVRKQLKGLSPEEYPKDFKPSLKDTLLLTKIGFAFSVPQYNYVDTFITQVGSKYNSLVGFFFNKHYPNPIGTGSFDEKYFRDHYDLKEVFNKFQNTPHIKVTFNNKTVEKSDYQKLANYEIVKSSDVRSVIVYKQDDECEIIIKTK